MVQQLFRAVRDVDEQPFLLLRNAQQEVRSLYSDGRVAGSIVLELATTIGIAAPGDTMVFLHETKWPSGWYIVGLARLSGMRLGAREGSYEGRPLVRHRLVFEDFYACPPDVARFVGEVMRLLPESP